MNRLFAVAPSQRLLPVRLGAAIIALAAAWSAAASAGNYVDVEPEVSASGQTHPPAASAAANTGGTQLLPDAVAPWERPGSATHAQQHESAAAPLPASASPAVAKATIPQSGSTEPAQTAAVSASAGDAALSESLLAVTRWSLNGAVAQQPDGELTIAAAAGQPLYLKFTIDGGQPAVDRLQADGHLAIEVHWARSGDAASVGAPDLTTELTIGRPGLASTLASEVQRQGHFEWHLWSRKDALSPGQWTVSLTYPDGTPVQCGEAQPHPCRLAVNAS